VYGVAELLEPSDQSAFRTGAIALMKVGGAEVDVWAIVLEEMADDNENGVTDGDGSLVPATARHQAVVLRG
jgi:hypothetical protein